MKRSDTQAMTLQAYEQNVHKYLEGTPGTVAGTEYQPFLDAFCEQLEIKDSILEIGSAVGRDADYIESKGFHVTRSDAVEAFIVYLESQGHEALYFDVLQTDLGQKYDAVLAQAVFLHFNEGEFVQALQNVQRHLKSGGCFALSVKSGDGEGFSDHKFGTDRFFKYWQYEPLQQLLAAHNFLIIESFFPENRWIQVVTKLSDDCE
jgi:SAM-dependent methyltransferase